MTAVVHESSAGLHRAVGVLRRVLLWSAIALVLAAAVVLVVVPKLVGGAALTVRTGSMAPHLAVGSVVVVRPVDPARLQVGDVATYAEGDSGALVTHRVVAVDATHSWFTFRGDANPVADPEQVPASAIRGSVWFDVPYLGSLRNAIGDSRTPLVVVGTALLGIYSVWQFAAAWRERKRS